MIISRPVVFAGTAGLSIKRGDMMRGDDLIHIFRLADRKRDRAAPALHLVDEKMSSAQFAEIWSRFCDIADQMDDDQWWRHPRVPTKTTNGTA